MKYSIDHFQNMRIILFYLASVILTTSILNTPPIQTSAINNIYYKTFHIMASTQRKSGINSVAVANTAAVISLGWFLFCRFFYLPFPNITINIFQSWFPALNLQLLWSDHLLGQFVVGMFTFPLAAWITAFLFSKLYKAFS
jgi:hypothetical protein